ncbi:uncharacterized short-chain type dehydrogenase/reductase y4vI-like [Uloborus diversus]|uniref:uncharacterized short-chain type dehydrogenase/reductase y4vI-like n=1 Tax=Uloborus diversus TaxID=327109 RepID=UPI0024092C02|nr:uncharacterized short-chain type dehydrogenase/reductase y4vI-like [Uloborus diversus]
MADHPVAIVTGGAQGIGAAIVKALLHKGYRVCIADLQEMKGKQFAESLNNEFGANKAIFILCDVTKEEDIERVFEHTKNKFQRVDVLVNNAGIGEHENPRKVIEVNVMGPIFGCRLALKHMGTSNGGKGGVVINTASVSGFLPNEALPSYTASKHAVIGLTRCYGLPSHLSRDGIIFSAICPHFCDTDILNPARTNPIEGLDIEFIKKHLMTPEYVAQGVLKILEDRINGSTLVITKDGYQYVGVQEERLNSFVSELLKQRHVFFLIERYSKQFGGMSESPVAIVTGGAQGLGAAISTALVQNGYRVCVSDINKTKCDDFVTKLQSQFGKEKAISVGGNVVNEADVKNLFEVTLRYFNHVDLLVNNAGIICEQDPRKVLDVNVIGVVNGINIALQYMGKSNGGKGGIVINTASIVGLIPYPALPIYVASKHAVVGLTRSYGLPHHFEKDGVLFAALCPSFVNTDILDDIRTKSLIQGLDVTQKPEVMSPEFVAQGVIKLLEDKINGSTLVAEKNSFKYVGLPEGMEVLE